MLYTVASHVKKGCVKVRFESLFPQIYMHEYTLISQFHCYSSFQVVAALYGDIDVERSHVRVDVTFLLHIADVIENIRRYYEN
jgi:hypothetical protein